ncbi:MAG: O-succinylhomoserine sulfhydrylase [Rhodospirillaceae bacterium]|mgnify:FL=1|nr:O-succinylhomoserine sulfhydrylase [Rhodospirillaceae bacterium]
MADDSAKKNWRPATQLVRGGTNRSNFAETNEGIFMTSGYIYETAEQAQRAFKGEEERFIYSRFSNPTVNMFQDRMKLLEGAESCWATATGMAAVFASLAATVNSGDRLVASKALFGSCDYVCRELLPTFGIETTMVEGTVLDQWRDALSQPTAAVFMETPSNPQMDVIDLPAVAELAHDAGARVVVDNVFATPILQKPLQLGADVVVYSATKHIDGQGRAMGGTILTNDVEWADGDLKQFLRHTGPSLSPFNAWVHLKGLETLHIRVRQHCKSAHEVANFMEGRKGIKRVIYPGLESHPQYELAKKQMDDSGTVVCFELEGNMANTFKFLNALEMIDISNNLGDAKSLVTHPATTTHQRLAPEARLDVGITDSLVRLSVGLEDVEDIKDDLAKALGE